MKDEFPIDIPTAERIDRRSFLHLAAVSACAAAGAEWVAAVVERRKTSVAGSVRFAAAEAPGPGRAVVVPLSAEGGAALVVRFEDGELLAFDRRCPHLGCPVLWSNERQRFECPCHRAAFDARTGCVLYGPPRRGLARLNLEIVDPGERNT